MRSTQNRSNRSFSQTRGDKSFMLTDIQVMQKDADIYTRKLELERKKVNSFMLAKQQLENEISQRKMQISKKLKSLREKKQLKIQSQLKTLQEQEKHNNVLRDQFKEKVEKVKDEIDKLRRERGLFKDRFEQLQYDINNGMLTNSDIRSQIDQNTTVYLWKSNEMYEFQNASLQRQRELQNEFNDLQKKLLENKNEEETKQKEAKYKESNQKESQESKQKDSKQKETRNSAFRTTKFSKMEEDNFDTATILKHRLQKIILQNKEKVNILDQYMRNMTIIDDAFNQIKETTGITDIQEIQNTFIKAEEQNYSLLTYVDTLHQEIDNIQDQINELQDKIMQQEKENLERKKILTATPDDDKFKLKMEEIIKSKENYIQEFHELLDKAQPFLEKVLLKLGESKFNVTPNSTKLFEYKNGILLNERTLLNFLSDIDEIMVQLFLYKAKKNNISNIITNYLLTDEIPVKIFNEDVQSQVQPVQQQLEENPQDQNKLLDQEQFEAIAIEALDKKKGFSNKDLPNQSMLNKGDKKLKK